MSCRVCVSFLLPRCCPQDAMASPPDDPIIATWYISCLCPQGVMAVDAFANAPSRIRLHNITQYYKTGLSLCLAGP